MAVISLVEAPDERIAIPRDLMERYCLRPNDRVIVEECANGIVLKKADESPVPSPEGQYPLDRLFEKVKALGLTDQDWEEMHRERDDSRWL